MRFSTLVVTLFTAFAAASPMMEAQMADGSVAIRQHSSEYCLKSCSSRNVTLPRQIHEERTYFVTKTLECPQVKEMPLLMCLDF
jgi:hypothetical protein